MIRICLSIVPDRTHSYHHTALSEISNRNYRIVGKILLCTRSIWYYSSDVVFTNIVVWFMGQSGAKTKFGV